MNIRLIFKIGRYCKTFRNSNKSLELALKNLEAEMKLLQWHKLANFNFSMVSFHALFVSAVANCSGPRVTNVSSCVDPRITFSRRSDFFFRLKMNERIFQDSFALLPFECS